MWFFSIITRPFSLCRGGERFSGDPKHWSCSGASAGGCGARKERRRRRRKLLPLLAGLLASSSGRRELRWVIPRLQICPQAPASCRGMRREAGRGRKAGAGSAAVLFPRRSSSLDPLCLLVSLGGQEPGARQRVRQEHSAGQEGAGGRLPALREAQRPRGQLHGAVSRRYRAPRGSLGRARACWEPGIQVFFHLLRLAKSVGYA